MSIRAWLKQPAKQRTKGIVVLNGALDVIGTFARDRRVSELEKRVKALETEREIERLFVEAKAKRDKRDKQEQRDYLADLRATTHDRPRHHGGQRP